MEVVRPQDTQQNKSSTLRHREHSEESVDKRPNNSSACPTEDGKRPIRRVRSPSRPRAWLSSSYKPKFGGKMYQPRFSRDEPSEYKPGLVSYRHYGFTPRTNLYRRDHQSKLHHIMVREREREKEERYEQKESADGSSCPKQNNSTRTFLPKSTSSRDKDVQFTVCQNDRNQSRERDHSGSKSKERERSRDRELPSTDSQTVARDRAIQQKRREIDEVYYQECELFGLVAKMLIEKDPSLEGPIQSSLQENLRDIGKRCVEAMEKFIEEYDSMKVTH